MTYNDYWVHTFQCDSDENQKIGIYFNAEPDEEDDGYNNDYYITDVIDYVLAFCETKKEAVEAADKIVATGGFKWDEISYKVWHYTK